ncbi:hypothetical protein B0J12DRAFT_782249, partial [Macrophomina phaseolina]
MSHAKPKPDGNASQLPSEKLRTSFDNAEKKIRNVCQESQTLLNNIVELKENHKKLKKISDELVKLLKEETERLKNKHSRLQSEIYQNRIILVLIDGDDTNFLESFVKKGIDGGSDAATELVGEIRKAARSQAKILVRVYANLGLNGYGLAQKYTRLGDLEKKDFYKFVSGFNKQEHCDFTDTGHKAGNAYLKVTEVFELYVKNYHCEQIFFAGAHDARYSALLAKYKYPEKIRKSLDI